MKSRSMRCFGDGLPQLCAARRKCPEPYAQPNGYHVSHGLWQVDHLCWALVLFKAFPACVQGQGVQPHQVGCQACLAWQACLGPGQMLALGMGQPLGLQRLAQRMMARPWTMSMMPWYSCFRTTCRSTPGEVPGAV